MQDTTESSFNRLAVSLMEKHGYDYDKAVEVLESFKIALDCGDNLYHSLPLQAGLLSAANSGKRAFLGGVYIHLPKDADCLLPQHRGKTLGEVLRNIGANVNRGVSENEIAFTLTFGKRSLSNDRSLEVICNDWQGGVTNVHFPIELISQNQMGLGGVAAGAIAVGVAFLIVSGIDPRCADKPVGISLWRPDLKWLNPEGVGPLVQYLPAKLWILGLGHLGQGYLWSLSFLPYRMTSETLMVLQDYDNVVEANYGAGLITEKTHAGYKKTRVCANYLEGLGFNTRIVERKFDPNTKTGGDEPLIALCGFDNAEGRMCLEDAGFQLVVEAGIGGKLESFDDISIHTFPGGTKQPRDIWQAGVTVDVNKSVLKEAQNKEVCGALFDVLSQKAISTSFVGMLTGALVLAEVLRASNCGPRYENQNLQIRGLNYRGAYTVGNYTHEAAVNGLISI